MKSVDLDRLRAAITHWRIRRHVWFELYYFADPPIDDHAGAWAALSEYDHVLHDCAAAGLIPTDWKAHPPHAPDDNGGFADDYLKRHHVPRDSARRRQP